MQKFVLSILLRIFNRLVRIAYKIPSKYSNDVNILKPESLEIKIPDKIKYLRIDIGLSDDAAHSVEALLDNEDRMIIGIEPHPKNIEGLKKGMPKHYSISLDNKYVRKGYNLKLIDDLLDKFIIIQGAAGSSKNIQERKFFSAYPDRGNSSFYETQSPEVSGNTSDEHFIVKEFSLNYLLSQIDFGRIDFIESIKIDTEGHDLEVIKGASRFMDRILYFRIECFRGIYPNSEFAEKNKFPSHILFGTDGYVDSASAIIEYLKNYNFSLISTQPGDYVFLNEKLKYKLLNHQVYPG